MTRFEPRFLLLQVYWSIYYSKQESKLISDQCYTYLTCGVIIMIFEGVSNYTTLMWAGDQNVDWSESDGLPSTITSALSMGLQVFLCCRHIPKIIHG